MVQLQRDLHEIQAAGTQVFGVSYDSVETLKKFSDSDSIGFGLLSDAGSQTIKAYGIHDRQGYPQPGTYLIDRQGTVRVALFLDGYRDRHANSELIEAAQKIEQSSTSN